MILIDKYINDINELGFNKNLTLNSKDVSKILSVKPRTLDNWRKENLGPNCKKIGKACIGCSGGGRLLHPDGI